MTLPGVRAVIGSPPTVPSVAAAQVESSERALNDRPAGSIGLPLERPLKASTQHAVRQISIDGKPSAPPRGSLVMQPLPGASLRLWVAAVIDHLAAGEGPIVRIGRTDHIDRAQPMSCSRPLRRQRKNRRVCTRAVWVHEVKDQSRRASTTIMQNTDKVERRPKRLPQLSCASQAPPRSRRCLAVRYRTPSCCQEYRYS
jgi:hypothetical protein